MITFGKFFHSRLLKRSFLVLLLPTHLVDLIVDYPALVVILLMILDALAKIVSKNGGRNRHGNVVLDALCVRF
jgi:hypothetical protein